MSTQQTHQNLTSHLLVPLEAGQGWKLELCERTEPTRASLDKIQRKIVLIAEGAVKAFFGSKDPVTIRSGELICIDSGVAHSLVPEGAVRFLDIEWDLPADLLPIKDAKCFGPRVDMGDYAVYDLVTKEKWGVALIEIQNSPRHFHKIEKEIFVVVSGELDIEIDGTHQHFVVGEFVVIHPKSVHQLKSASKEPVRVLCFSFPAFDPADMYLL